MDFPPFPASDSILPDPFSHSYGFLAIAAKGPWRAGYISFHFKRLREYETALALTDPRS